MDIEDVDNKVAIVQQIKRIIYRNVDDPNSSLDDMIKFLYIDEENINKVNVFIDMISSKMFLYLFKFAGPYFFNQSSYYWSKFIKEYLPTNPILEKYKSVLTFNLLLRDSRVEMFVENLNLLVTDYSEYMSERVLRNIRRRPKTFSPQKLVSLFNVFPFYINFLPSIAYTMIKYYKLKKYDPYPSEQSSVKNQAWKELFKITNIDDPVMEPTIMNGLKWLLIIKPSQESLNVLLEFDIEKVFDLDEFFRNVFDEDHPAFGNEILDFFTNEGNMNHRFYPTMKKYLFDHPNIVSKNFFGTEFIKPTILKMINFENPVPEIPDTWWTTSYYINEEFVQTIANTQKGFSEALFDSINRLFKHEYVLRNNYFQGQEELEKSKEILNLCIDDILGRLQIKLHIDFLRYLEIKDLIPILKQYSNLITKESIIRFLERQEPNPDIIQAWEDIWRLQHGDIEGIPPPPDWFIRQYDAANVHSKATVKVTDCRLKLLRDNFPQFDDTIESIAQEIEDITQQVAEINVKTEKDVSDEKEYIIKNTINKDDIFKCRLSD